MDITRYGDRRIAYPIVIDEKIGEGAYGAVYSIIGTPNVIKIQSVEKSQVSGFKKEFQLMDACTRMVVERVCIHYPLFLQTCVFRSTKARNGKKLTLSRSST